MLGSLRAGRCAGRADRSSEIGVGLRLIDITLVDSADALTSAEWDQWAGDHDVALTHLGVGLSERTARTAMRHIVARTGGNLRGVLPTAVATSESSWVLGRPDRIVAEAVAEGSFAASQSEVDRLSELPALVAGGRHMANSDVIGRRDLTAPELHAMVGAAEQLADERHLQAVMFPFVAETSTTLSACLTDRGYRSFSSGVYSTLDVRSGWDGYLAALPKKKRWIARDETKQIREAGLTSELRLLGELPIPVLARLESDLYAKYGLDVPAEQCERGLHITADLYGACAMASVVCDGEHFVGFVVLIRSEGRWFAKQVGFDYQRQGRLPVYFETLFYGPARAGQEHGVTTVHYGLGSVKAKASRGCDQERQFAFVKAIGA